jgi:hypothetical protein
MDARGVKTIIDYNGDPLNRMQTMRYDRSRVPKAVLKGLGF